MSGKIFKSQDNADAVFKVQDIVLCFLKSSGHCPIDSQMDLKPCFVSEQTGSRTLAVDC